MERFSGLARTRSQAEDTRLESSKDDTKENRWKTVRGRGEEEREMGGEDWEKEGTEGGIQRHRSLEQREDA